MEREVVRGERALNVSETARKYGASTSWVWAETAAGRIPQPMRFSPRCTRWLESELDADLARRASQRGGPVR